MSENSNQPTPHPDLLNAILSLSHATQCLMRLTGMYRQDPQPWPNEGYLSIQEAQLALRCSRASLYRHIKHGRIKVTKLAKRSRNGKRKTLVSAASLREHLGYRNDEDHG